MQFKIALVATALATLAVATPARRAECDTGPVCCNSVQKADSKDVTLLAGLLGIVISDVTALVGLNCSPISVIGLGGNSCSSPVCCSDNKFGGLIALGCVPISIGV
ncbi:hypothetical protein HGRIS_013745 [Hohenbuehelia grisea]|uniref:Hydrophobin n=1 Tax=Hohenbuehelia grisea TaxID=104357 RepID=A0ABR3IWL0_9AGAR